VRVPDIPPALTDTGRIHEVAIIGAGPGGITAAHLLRRNGIEDFVILEKQAGLGGTWWDNRYPGAHVDVPALL
jgi:cation diffusion facilitator CzcD-associated flavoprotein CzcO